MYSFEKDVKTFTPVPLSPRQEYEDQLKLNGKSKNEEKNQPCEDLIKTEKIVSQEIRRLDLDKIKINGDSAKRE